MRPFHFAGPEERRPVLITGGAGFLGTNLAHRLLSGGNAVIIFDDLSAPGVERNLRWLRTQHRERLNVVVADIRDEKAMAGAARQAGQIYHFAARTSLPASLADPVADFEVNVRGTLNVLEAVRALDREVPVLFASTSKVYGELGEVALTTSSTRYSVTASSPLSDGVGESRPADPRSPHACAKRAAEEYVLGYAHSYGLPATVLRLGSIYGPHQGGGSDQGWVAGCLLRALQNEPVTIHGNGKQVRDVLFVEDLMDALLFAQANMAAVSGRPFNLGGGPGNSLSPLELVALTARLQHKAPEVMFVDGHVGDPKFYVSDIRRFGAATGWKPRVGVREGVHRLFRWLIEHRVAEAEAEQIAAPSAVAVGRDVEFLAGPH